MYKIAQILYKTSHGKLEKTHQTDGRGYRVESEWPLHADEISNVSPKSYRLQ